MHIYGGLKLGLMHERLAGITIGKPNKLFGFHSYLIQFQVAILMCWLLCVHAYIYFKVTTTSGILYNDSYWKYLFDLIFLNRDFLIFWKRYLKVLGYISEEMSLILNIMFEDIK